MRGEMNCKHLLRERWPDCAFERTRGCEFLYKCFQISCLNFSMFFHLLQVSQTVLKYLGSLRFSKIETEWTFLKFQK